MGIEYVDVNFMFDIVEFAQVVVQSKYHTENDEGVRLSDTEFSVLVLGLHPEYMSTIRRWATSGMSDHQKDGISISRLLHICNRLNLDPRDYFLLESSGGIGGRVKK